MADDKTENGNGNGGTQAELTTAQEKLIQDRQITVWQWLNWQVEAPGYSLVLASPEDTDRAKVMFLRDIMLAKASIHNDGRNLLDATKWGYFEEAFKYPATVFYDKMDLTAWTAVLTGENAITKRFYAINTTPTDAWTPTLKTDIDSFGTVSVREALRKVGFIGGAFGYSEQAT